MSKDGYYGDFDSFADEQRAYEKYMEEQAIQEFLIAPCYSCNAEMWKESDNHEENLCINCKPKTSDTKPDKTVKVTFPKEDTKNVKAKAGMED